jgi:hypothetical protein
MNPSIGLEKWNKIVTNRRLEICSVNDCVITGRKAAYIGYWLSRSLDVEQDKVVGITTVLMGRIGLVRRDSGHLHISHARQSFWRLSQVHSMIYNKSL